MDTYSIIINLATLLFGGGIGWLINWNANRRKAEGEAKQTEAEAMKSVQDVYQQALADQQSYIEKLKDTRDHLIIDREEVRRENIELRKRLNQMDERVRQLEHDVARNGRIMQTLRPLLCGRIGCQHRTEVDLGSSEGEENDK